MLRVKKYKPVKTEAEILQRYVDYLRHYSKDGKCWVNLVPIEIYGLDTKGKTGAFTFEDIKNLIC